MFGALASMFLVAAHITFAGPLVDTHDSVAVRSRSISLIADSGKVRWRWRTPRGSARTAFLAAGDLNGDHAPEIVVASYWRLGSVCGTTPRSVAALYILDGRSGRASRFGPRLADSCFHFGRTVYPMDQWIPGTVSISRETIVAFPTYATEGYLRNCDGLVQHLVFPSTPAYDHAFRGCHRAPGSPNCYVPYSHIANVVFVPGGLFVLTSKRALTYRAGKPFDDLTWVSGTTANGGRNKGFAFTFVDRGRRYAELVGGCTVADEQRAIRLHVLPAGIIGNCSIHHHFEWFRLQGLRIAAHVNRYYGYIGTDGYLRSRLEVPARADGPLGGRGTHWTVFNRFDGTDWHLQVLPDPARPDLVLDYNRTYAWGMADLIGDGKAELLVTHGSGYFLPWRFSVLSWSAGHWRELHHLSGFLPTLLQYPDSGGQHCSDSRSLALPDQGGGDSCFGVRTSRRRLLVETLRGSRFWLRVATGPVETGIMVFRPRPSPRRRLLADGRRAPRAQAVR